MAFKTRDDLINAYINFFKGKNHKEIPSSSLIPTDDPTVLFTTAGMHPLIPFIIGQKHPLGKKLVGVQKCIRTGDIDEVGDEIHHTFFEMLGNWSLGDYWKKEALEYSIEFLTKILKIPKEKINVTCFAGDKNAPKDEETAKIWQNLGIKKEHIKFLPKKDNWWGPAGEFGPCGPDTEMFVKGFEIWNDVFIEYNKTKVKAILVDAISCLFDKDRNLNRELLDMLKNYSTKLIVVTNANLGDAKNNPLIELKREDIEIFTLKRNPDKTNSDYFKKLLNQYQLKPEEIIYFDHADENTKSAKRIGIKTELYKNPKQIKKFINDNLYHYIKAKQKNIDTGMGVERTLAVLNNLEDDYQTPLFQPIIKEIEKISGKTYDKNKKEMRIIADHIKAAVFILGDERTIKPSNIGQGYVLRRLIRRAIRYGKILGINNNFTSKIVKIILPIYPDYPELKKDKKSIETQLNEEETRFNKTLEKGLKKFNYLTKEKTKEISGKDGFLLSQSYGFPIEMTQELAKEKGIVVDKKGYRKELEKHQTISGASVISFKSGLADSSENTTKLHTATHMLDETLRRVLKDNNIKQKGSNITPERLRFDFNFSRKLTDGEIKQIEQLVNQKIRESLIVKREEMPLKKAIASGAGNLAGAKYPEIVSVYTIEDKKEKHGFFSKEICTGPHVKNTSELGKFKIIKEESVAAGIRRIKAIVE